MSTPQGAAHLSPFGIDQLAAVVRTRFPSVKYRPALIDAFITETGLVIQPRPPRSPHLFRQRRDALTYPVRPVAAAPPALACCSLAHMIRYP